MEGSQSSQEKLAASAMEALFRPTAAAPIGRKWWIGGSLILVAATFGLWQLMPSGPTTMLVPMPEHMRFAKVVSDAGPTPASAKIDLNGSGASVPPELDRFALYTTFWGHVGEVRECYDAEMSKSKVDKGEIVMNFRVSATGAPLDIHPGQNTLRNDSLAICIQSKMETWTFAKPLEGKESRTAMYPLRFSN